MVLLFISFVAGILTILAPCILPLLPVVIGGTVSSNTPSKKRALTVVLSLGVSVIVFTLLLKASTLFIDIPEIVWKSISGGYHFIFGLVTLFPSLWDKVTFTQKIAKHSNESVRSGYLKQSFWGDVIVGASLGPVFSTCSPTYFVILATVLPQGFLQGLIYLLAYTLGLILILLLVALLGQRLVTHLGIAANPNGLFKKIIGIIFIVLGLAIIGGFDKDFERYLLEKGIWNPVNLELRLLELQNK